MLEGSPSAIEVLRDKRGFDLDDGEFAMQIERRTISQAIAKGLPDLHRNDGGFCAGNDRSRKNAKRRGGGKRDVAARLKPEGALALDQMKCKWENAFGISSLSVFENQRPIRLLQSCNLTEGTRLRHF
jgi:hypothetical protein